MANEYWMKQQRRNLEDAVEEKYKVMAGARSLGEFADAVNRWWRMYGSVRQKSREYRGVDLTAHEAATDFVDMSLRWR